MRLIKRITEGEVDELQGVLMRSARAGLRVEEVRRQIRERLGTTRKRAALIVRDQVSKLNGALTQLRQQSVGVTEYVWATSRDERVRSRHRELDGKRFRWEQPPVVDASGRRAHPGQDVQCRCM